MALFRCPECGKITSGEGSICKRCGAKINEASGTSAMVMCGLVSLLMGALLLFLYIELHSISFLVCASAFIALGLYEVFFKQKKKRII